MADVTRAAHPGGLRAPGSTLALGLPVSRRIAAGFLPVAVAAAISAVFLWSATREPLPALGWAAAFLFLVVEEDVRSRRIPNWLTLPAIAIALLLALFSTGPSGAARSLLGAATAFAILFPVFCLRGMGAGDVKALMVLGALWGPIHLLGGLWWMVVAAGVMGIAIGAARGVLLEVFRRIALSFWASVAARRPVYLGCGSSGAESVPFGPAIALGASAYQLWGLPWA